MSIEASVKPVDVVIDTIGGDVLTKSFQVVKKGGIVVSTIDFENIKSASQFGVQGKTVMAKPNFQQLSDIADLLDRGIIKAHVDATFPLAEVQKAHKMVESGHARGKVTLEITEAETEHHVR